MEDDPRHIKIDAYSYELPDDRIAYRPVEERDKSKLLIYSDRVIRQDLFKNVVSHLHENALIIFNNSKVIEARLLFQKTTGARIEIFCLEPADQANDPGSALDRHSPCTWKCLVGNAAAWPAGLRLEKTVSGDFTLHAEITERASDHFLVRFSWQPQRHSFGEMLHMTGLMPLPPYIKRNTEISDNERYQTVYAHKAGSVAAPTAGLHFTREILQQLEQKKMVKDFVTLHVGAGTFMPVKGDTIADHKMHAEYIEINRSLIDNILNRNDAPVIAVGTTSLRTLETLYWIGAKIIGMPDVRAEALAVGQWEPYQSPGPPAREALTALLSWMDRHNRHSLITKTSLLIAPSYQFKIVDTLITNFHQPRSTLLLLVAAFIGEDWKKVYQYALENDFRFLSYGDACLLFRR